MIGKASGIYKEFLDNVRGEYERVIYGRRTTEELEVLAKTPDTGRIPIHNRQDDDIAR